MKNQKLNNYKHNFRKIPTNSLYNYLNKNNSINQFSRNGLYNGINNGLNNSRISCNLKNNNNIILPNNLNNIKDKLYNGISHNNHEINNNLYYNLTDELKIIY